MTNLAGCGLTRIVILNQSGRELISEAESLRRMVSASVDHEGLVCGRERVNLRESEKTPWQELRHAVSPKLLVQLSMAAAGAVALATIIDLAIGVPFGRAMMFDIMFLISAAVVLYLGWESYRELT